MKVRIQMAMLVRKVDLVSVVQKLPLALISTLTVALTSCHNHRKPLDRL